VDVATPELGELDALAVEAALLLIEIDAVLEALAAKEEAPSGDGASLILAAGPAASA